LAEVNLALNLTNYRKANQLLGGVLSLVTNSGGVSLIDDNIQLNIIAKISRLVKEQQLTSTNAFISLTLLNLFIEGRTAQSTNIAVYSQAFDMLNQYLISSISDFSINTLAARNNFKVSIVASCL